MSKTKDAYRRCHVCGHTCQAKDMVKRCQSCGKPFAPFYYYQDEFKPVLFEGGLRPPHIQGEYQPIQGLTAYWQLD